MPRTFVRKNPAHNDTGIRYYRPKPYLVIKPYRPEQIGENTVQPGLVQLSLEYLPDFSEEYSLHIRTGFGSNNTSVTLEDGWNLTTLNATLDSQTDENITALGSLLGSVAGLAKSGGTPDVPRPADPIIVEAQNVPIGYYEAVVGDCCGRKFLYGFRYVGFMPYCACPIHPCGGPQLFDCRQTPSPIHRLVYQNNVLRFIPIDQCCGPLVQTAKQAQSARTSAPDSLFSLPANRTAAAPNPNIAVR